MEFREFFQNQEDNLPQFGMVMKYNSVRIDKSINRIIFVEGFTDSRFYSSTSINELSESARYFYSNSKEERVGKEAVFYTFNRIKSNSDLSRDMNRCIFIVDRDWELSLKSEDNLISGKDRDHFTVTQGHSMECYFLEHDNLRVTFSEMGLSDLLKDFEDRLERFKLESFHYWALKGSIQYGTKHGIRLRYKKKYDWSEIFIFDFENNICFEVEKMKEEILLMEEALKCHPDLENYCKKWDQKIKEESRFIRGHDIFNFLISYILFAKGIKNTSREKIEAKVKSLVPQFNVLIDIKHCWK